MRNFLPQRLAALLLTAGSVGLAACGNGPVATGTESASNRPSLSVAPPPVDATPEAGKIKICKAGNINGTFTVTREAVGSPDIGTVVAAPDIAAGDCQVVAEDPSGNNVGSNVTITEIPATYLTGVTIQRVGEVSPTSSANGATAFVNSAHGSTFTFTNDKPAPPEEVVALFVIGDVEPHAIGDNVNFWGAQWWKNNFMSGVVSNGVAAFKGYASVSGNDCGKTWTSLPGNSPHPPAVIPDDVAIIVTTTVLKVGPNISGDIKQIVMVKSDGGYGPAPGKAGNGPVTSIVCSL